MRKVEYRLYSLKVEIMICFNLSKCSNLLFALNPKLSQCNILSEHVQRVRHSALAPEAQPNEEQRRNRGVLAPAGARHGHGDAVEGDNAHEEGHDQGGKFACIQSIQT